MKSPPHSRKITFILSQDFLPNTIMINSHLNIIPSFHLLSLIIATHLATKDHKICQLLIEQSFFLLVYQIHAEQMIYAEWISKLL